jgi:predicted CXXCH cytochrome family protein
VALSALAWACSEPARSRVLNFFFDGVDQPEEDRRRGYAPTGRAISGELGEAAARRGQPERLMVIHAPYRENKCDACHNANTGLLFQPPQGLCRSCHADIPGPAPFVHGPVIVGACLACHHPHGSAYPHVLLADASSLCFNCHRQEDLGPAPYHILPAEQTCNECHDAHGGADQYFLRPDAGLGPLYEAPAESIPAPTDSLLTQPVDPEAEPPPPAVNAPKPTDAPIPEPAPKSPPLEAETPGREGP